MYCLLGTDKNGEILITRMGLEPHMVARGGAAPTENAVNISLPLPLKTKI